MRISMMKSGRQVGMARMKSLALAMIAALPVALPSAASAAVTVNINQVGTDVVATSSGSLNLTGLTSQGGFFSGSAIQGNSAFVFTGNGPSLTGYSGFAGPASFGTGALVGTTGTGASPFGINGGYTAGPTAFVSSAYVSGTSLASAATFANSTFASLGLTLGTYVYTSANDTVTVNIGQSLAGAVPEPASWAMMIGGFGMAGSALRRRRQTAASVFGV